MDLCIERLPVSQLRPFVECIWHSDPTDDTRFEIIPDGCVDACFVLSEKKPRTILFGTTTQTSAYDLEAGAPYFGVRFRAGMASLFVQEKIADLTDSELQVATFLGLSADEVLDLSVAANITSQIGGDGVVPLRQYLIGFKSQR